MNPPASAPVIRLRAPAPGAEAPRAQPRRAHPPAVVEAVRALVEGTALPYRAIAARSGVDSGTVARWVEKHGWRRPPGAAPATARPDRRAVPAVIGRALAQRLRAEAERLVCAIESAPAVDPAALAKALRLLAEARKAQQLRRGRRSLPPGADPATAALPAPESAAEAEKRRRRERREAAIRGWRGRWARRVEGEAGT